MTKKITNRMLTRYKIKHYVHQYTKHITSEIVTSRAIHYEDKSLYIVVREERAQSSQLESNFPTISNQACACDVPFYRCDQ